MQTHDRCDAFHSRAFRSPFYTLIAILCILAALAPSSQAQYLLGPLSRISGSDPFANNTKDNPNGQSGTLYPNSSVEPWVSVDPTNLLHIVATYQQDRWSGGGSRGLMEVWSIDGGVTWHPVAVPGIGLTTGGTAQAPSDPWNAFAPNGDLYHVSLADGILVSKSTDGGQTWSAPITLKTGSSDKESVFADPFDYHYAYVGWDSDIGAFFSRTTDAGVTWSTPIHQTPSLSTLDHQFVVAPNDTLYNFFNDYATNADTASFVSSSDHGATWSAETTAIIFQDTYVYDPINGDYIRDSAGLFPIAIDRHNGNLYIAWMDDRFSNGQIDEIAFSGSTDGGKTWSTPIKINKTPTNINLDSRQCLIPTLAVADDGTICVAYYDFRHTKTGPELWTDRFAVFCHPSSATPFSSPSSWGNEMRLTQTSFDFHLAPYTGDGLMVGDYMSMQAIGNEFMDVFGVTSADYPSYIVARRIRRYARADFNQDGKSDLLFQNPNTGQLAVWYMSGNAAAGAAFITPTQNPGWRAVGTADFNGDGQPDILFQNAQTGQLAVWYMNGTQAVNGALIVPTQDPAWQAVAVADTQTNGQPEILFQNASTGQMAIWNMNGAVATYAAYVTPTQNPAWKAVSLADFNRDGKLDILFQNQSSGQMAIWYMNGTTEASNTVITPTQSPAWAVAAVADVNGDGYPDIVFQNPSTGQLALWTMNNSAAVTGTLISPSQSPAWKAVGLR